VGDVRVVGIVNGVVRRLPIGSRLSIYRQFMAPTATRSPECNQYPRGNGQGGSI
jgi:hypothetical protein